MSSKARSGATQAPSDNVVEFPQPDRWASSPKEHVRKICTLAFEQINRDHDLSAHARCVGIDILSHVNWQKGYAEVGMEKTALRLDFKEDTVSKGRDALVARGYFRYEPGKAGRKHSGRYWPVLQPAENPHAVGYSEKQKTPVSRPENPQMTEIKPPRRGVEQYINNGKNKSAASPRAPEYADIDEDNLEQVLDHFKRSRGRAALNVPYNDPDFISFDEPRWSGHPTTTVAASS
ncbi:hypothetical protein [Bradyrhizobium sp.]|uniref:hypothetical protein n=1 Tax=Bradyrhizobium sp. TaxID=376 RepID=UPI003BAE57F7